MLGVQSATTSGINPTITGLSYQSQISMPQKSLLLAIYQDAKQMETRYLPVQALQNCFK
jgi:hypothetical protein